MKFILVILVSLFFGACSSSSKSSTTTNSRDSVRERIVQNQEEFRDCAKDGEVQGDLILQWKVGSDGFPQEITEVKNSIDNPRVSQCVVNQVQSIEFPVVAANPYMVKFPFEFRLINKSDNADDDDVQYED